MNDTNEDVKEKVALPKEMIEKDDNYPLDKKRTLKDKIESITDEDTLRKVKDIIIFHNPELEITRNSNGVFLRFRHLKYETYMDLEKLLKKIERKKIKDICSDISQSSSSENKINKTQKNLRLTNNENHIINRAKYEKQLRKNEFHEEDDVVFPKDFIQKNSDSDIFVKKEKTKK